MIKNQAPDARSYVDVAFHNASEAIYQQFVLLGSRFKKTELDDIVDSSEIYKPNNKLSFYYSIIEKEKLEHDISTINEQTSASTVIKKKI